MCLELKTGSYLIYGFAKLYKNVTVVFHLDAVQLHLKEYFTQKFKFVEFTQLQAFQDFV